MSFWLKVKSFLGVGNEPARKPPNNRTVNQPPVTTPEPPARRTDTVDRTVHPRNDAYESVWADMQRKLDRSLSSRGVIEFNRRQERLAGLFDIIGDPGQSDNIQRDAYDELADELADFGFVFTNQGKVSDFDWADFGANYPMMGK